MALNITEIKRGRVTFLNIQITDTVEEILSQPFNIDDTVEVWFRLKETDPRRYFYYVYILAQSHKSALNSSVKLNVRCDNMGSGAINEQLTCPRGLFMGRFNCVNTIDIRMMASKAEPIRFPKLYEDKDFTDFYLSSEEGRVAVHRTILAAHSDMFKTMLLGKWKETEEGRVELKGLTLETLQQLKEYMYLGTLPEDVRQLLLLTKCYLLPNLKEDCMVQLAWTASPENLYELQDFAFENGLKDLTRLLLQVATSEVIDGAHRLERVASKNNKVDE